MRLAAVVDEEGSMLRRNAPEEVSVEGLDIHRWLKIGIDQGWVSEPRCGNHDGFILDHELEELEEEDIFDGCFAVLRILPS